MCNKLYTSNNFILQNIAIRFKQTQIQTYMIQKVKNYKYTHKTHIVINSNVTFDGHGPRFHNSKGCFIKSLAILSKARLQELKVVDNLHNQDYFNICYLIKLFAAVFKCKSERSIYAPVLSLYDFSKYMRGIEAYVSRVSFPL